MGTRNWPKRIMMMHSELRSGDLVWFDPGVGYVLPGEVIEYHENAQVIMVQAVINNVTKNFTLNNLSSVRPRQDLGQGGVEDMISLRDINEASILWNIRLRYDNRNIYTFIGTILISVNPYRAFDEDGENLYGLKSVAKYDGQILGTLPPHLFAIGASALARQVAYPKKNYLSAVNKSASNLKTEQIIEASHLLESFGHAQTLRNNNSSRFGKFIQMYFKDGIISGAKFNDYLLEKKPHRERVQESMEKKNDKADFENLISSFQVLGFSLEERDAIFKVLASILHLGNVYFHRKHFRNGVEGVEMGSNVEIKWTAHLLQLTSNSLIQVLTSRISPDSLGEPIIVPMNIDQALDVRDALSKSLYGTLFTWIIKRLNKIISTKSKGVGMNKGICILDMFGFEDLNENSFEQLCINFANENLHSLINKRIFKAEQAEYAKEQIDWTPINYIDNGPILNILSKKPVGIFHLLDDESNFPKANDTSFLDKCHYNHALNELYSRPRMSSREFGVKHYAGQVWYNVDGFLRKNRDSKNPEIISLLSTTRDRHLHNIGNDHLVTMKPRTATVSARFIENLHQLLGIIQDSHPFYVLCIKPNNSKVPAKFDMPLVLDQLRVNTVLETIMIRKTGYPIRMKYKHFVEKFKCLLGARYPNIGYYGGGTPTTKEMARNIVEKHARNRGDDYEFGSTKVFLKEHLRKKIETERRLIHDEFLNKKKSAVKIQAAYRGWTARQDYCKMRKGVIALQAIYRMKKQQSNYSQLKERIHMQHQAEEEEKRRRRIVEKQKSLCSVP
ncbi:unnamed protein product [Lepeophtheirus salmonis]|uniref:(salmon louse) hypothetical protein n=1 Tax=Lepeophtheirus salmonis TaxID=72036 RepID=A0A7R8D5Y9_LEPSM|nr:unnamed protein product [Lepeophtheirus salmonis]CAF3038517.1 unnamed protein product [Lepeophtheirus salmonis]